MIFKSNLSKNTIFIRLLFLFSLSGLLFSQSINGFVREESSGEPISYANIFLENTSLGAATNRDGYFVISDIPMGSYTLNASMIGYGLTSILIALRSLLVPSYIAKTQTVNIVYASIYTGGFMAIVSNIRYQLLQGIIELKIIEKLFAKFPVIKAAMIFLVRLGNGLLGSSIAIAGMKFFGLQKLK